MHATYGWTAAGKLPCSQDIRPTSPRIGTIPQCVPPLGRLAQRCLLLCCAHALLTTALDANAMPPQESPQEFPSTATGFDIDRPTFEILAGFNGALPGLPEIWQAGFMEDLNDTNRTADFALFMSWSIFFGHRASTTR
jgi:hypothetical protein